MTSATGDASACALDGLYGGLAVDFAGVHENANAALDEFGILHVHVDHEVFVHIAKAVIAPVVIMLRIIFWAVAAFMRVEPEMTSAPTSATIAISAAEAMGVPLVAGDGRRKGAAGACVGCGGNNVGGASGSREADDNVFPGGAATGYVALAQFFRVFVDLDRGGQGLGPAGP